MPNEVLGADSPKSANSENFTETLDAGKAIMAKKAAIFDLIRQQETLTSQSQEHAQKARALEAQAGQVSLEIQFVNRELLQLEVAHEHLQLEAAREHLQPEAKRAPSQETK